MCNEHGVIKPLILSFQNKGKGQEEDWRKQESKRKAGGMKENIKMVFQVRDRGR